MPEQTIVADPAPATEIQAPPNPDSPEYANWRVTGKIPDPPKAEPESVKTAPVSETGDRQQERRPSKAEARLNELLQDLKRAGLTPSELKTFKREARQAAEVEAESRALERTVKPAEGAPKRPKYEDFKTLEEFQTADDKWRDEITDLRIRKAIQEDRMLQARQAGEREMHERLEKAEKRYGEGSKKTITQTAIDIFQNKDVNSSVKEILDESDVLEHLMYVIGSKPDALAEFLEEARTAPKRAKRRVVELERLVQEELAKLDKSPRKVSEEPDEEIEDEEPPPAKKVTKAGPPPREASGRAAAPPDEVASAVSAGDARRYFAEQNRRDLQRRRTG